MGGGDDAADDQIQSDEPTDAVARGRRRGVTTHPFSSPLGEKRLSGA
jgi:hypothetical protein